MADPAKPTVAGQLGAVRTPLEPKPAIRIETHRGPILEVWNDAYGVLWDAESGQTAAAWGDPALVTTLRSSLKPVQALILLVDGLVDRYGLNDDDIAIMVGSHSGEGPHRDAVRAFMHRTRVVEEHLRCGIQPPFSKAAKMEARGEHTVYHNNCSGKHTGMVAWSLAHGHDPAGYLDPTHPVQERILEITAHLSGVPKAELLVGVDGCGVPTIGMSLSAMARMFAHLARPATAPPLPGTANDVWHAALARVARVMAEHGFLIAGTNRPDTDVIAATNGRVCTKAGAEGVWCGFDQRSGNGFAFKVLDGNFRSTVAATLEALGSVGILDRAELAALARHHQPVAQTLGGAHAARTVARLS